MTDAPPRETTAIFLLTQKGDISDSGLGKLGFFIQEKKGKEGGLRVLFEKALGCFKLRLSI
jgi:hypothetical protein